MIVVDDPILDVYIYIDILCQLCQYNDWFDDYPILDTSIESRIIVYIYTHYIIALWLFNIAMERSTIFNR